MPARSATKQQHLAPLKKSHTVVGRPQNPGEDEGVRLSGNKENNGNSGKNDWRMEREQRGRDSIRGRERREKRKWSSDSVSSSQLSKHQSGSAVVESLGGEKRGMARRAARVTEREAVKRSKGQKPSHTSIPSKKRKSITIHQESKQNNASFPPPLHPPSAVRVEDLERGLLCGRSTQQVTGSLTAPCGTMGGERAKGISVKNIDSIQVTDPLGAVLMKDSQPACDASAVPTSENGEERESGESGELEEGEIGDDEEEGIEGGENDSTKNRELANYSGTMGTVQGASDAESSRISVTPLNGIVIHDDQCCDTVKRDHVNVTPLNTEQLGIVIQNDQCYNNVNQDHVMHDSTKRNDDQDMIVDDITCHPMRDEGEDGAVVCAALDSVLEGGFIWTSEALTQPLNHTPGDSLHPPRAGDTNSAPFQEVTVGTHVEASLTLCNESPVEPPVEASLTQCNESPVESSVEALVEAPLLMSSSETPLKGTEDDPVESIVDASLEVPTHSSVEAPLLLPSSETQIKGTEDDPVESSAGVPTHSLVEGPLLSPVESLAGVSVQSSVKLPVRASLEVPVFPTPVSTPTETVMEEPVPPRSDVLQAACEIDGEPSQKASVHSDTHPEEEDRGNCDHCSNAVMVFEVSALPPSQPEAMQEACLEPQAMQTACLVGEGKTQEPSISSEPRCEPQQGCSEEHLVSPLTSVCKVTPQSPLDSEVQHLSPLTSAAIAEPPAACPPDLRVEESPPSPQHGEDIITLYPDVDTRGSDLDAEMEEGEVSGDDGSGSESNRHFGPPSPKFQLLPSPDTDFRPPTPSSSPREWKMADDLPVKRRRLSAVEDVRKGAEPRTRRSSDTQTMRHRRSSLKNRLRFSELELHRDCLGQWGRHRRSDRTSPHRGRCRCSLSPPPSRERPRRPSRDHHHHHHHHHHPPPPSHHTHHRRRQS